MNKPFLEMAIPLVCESLKTKKSGVQAQLKAICGDFYKDPNSPIHIAWDFWQTCTQKQHEKKLEVDDLLKALSPFYSEDDLRFVAWLCQDRGDDFMLSEEGNLVGNFSVEQLEVINVAHIPHYQKIVISIREFLSGRNREHDLLCNYTILERKRIACEKELVAVEEELNSLVPGEVLGLGLQNHVSRLKNEFERLLRAEEALLNAPLLQKCLELCFAQKPNSEDRKNEICGLINSCSHQVKTIWHKLRPEFFKGAPGEQLNEKYFDQFLFNFMPLVTAYLNKESKSILDAIKAQLKALQQ